MIVRPTKEDVKLIVSYTGKVIIGVSLLLLVPLATSLISGEWACASYFALSLGISLAIGFLLAALGETTRKPTWMHGMVTGGVSWIAVMAVSALPYWLSGHYISYLDAMFDVMSGFTTTGLVLIQDLDHVPDGLNMWRHLLTFVGGQGMIVLALAFLVKDSGGGYKLYVGEGKDERLFPSVFHTAKAIWKISLIYLAVGTAALWVVGIAIGLRPDRAFLHGLWVYMAAWSTGGFAPTSMNILYYHSALYEIVTAVFFILGSFNFALHNAVWNGSKKEILKNIETVSFTITLSALTLIACWALMRKGVYPDLMALIRKGFYQLASAHTTTGFMSLYPRQLAAEWGDLAIFAMIIAMLIGGSACSTAGGFKGLRVGIIWKAIVQETRKLLKPGSAVFAQRFHYHGERNLSESQVRSAALIVIMYVATFLFATGVGCAAGYPFLEAAFESASVTGNVGFSIGVTQASMPGFLKVCYILVMWAGRLEFMAVLATAAFLASFFRRKPI
jgi:trk system potassium uptake protein TrkH